MPTAINSENTLLGAAIGLGADGNELAFVNTLAKMNPLESLYWEEANDFMSHSFTQASNLPSGSDVRVNRGTAWSAGVQKPVIEPIQALRAYNRIDYELYASRRNPNAYRQIQDELTIEGIKQTFFSRLFYGDRTTSIDQIDGVLTRADSLTAPSFGTVIDGGATGSATTSVIVAKLDRSGLFLTFPREGQQFIEVVDESPGGPIVVYDGSNDPYDAMVTKFIIRFGLCIGDNRNVVSIRNCNTTAGATSPTPSNLVQALGTIYGSLDNVVIFMNRDAKKNLDMQVVTNTNFVYTQETLWGRRVDAFQGIPIYLTEAITSTETATT